MKGVRGKRGKSKMKEALNGLSEPIKALRPLKGRLASDLDGFLR